VKIAGVELGRVTKIALAKIFTGFMAVVNMALNRDKKIPANYSASIAMSGNLGDKYVALRTPSEDLMAIAGIADDNNSS
ncbi:MlaD family protein, partial [Francisella tularensis subsp. holarctica]|uniref:MlaD family protein n=1 Tax=Francisella tularensis TaxID=263 RepID=UPI0023819D45